jgi:hypothetical protein
MSVIGRLPVRYDTRKAIVKLPQSYKAVECAFVIANTAVAGDCYINNEDVPHPAVRSVSPLRDGSGVIVYFHPERTDGGTEIGPGWEDGAYGGQPETRAVDLGIPYVEVEIKVSRSFKCGCSDQNPYG